MYREEGVFVSLIVCLFSVRSTQGAKIASFFYGRFVTNFGRLALSAALAPLRFHFFGARPFRRPLETNGRADGNQKKASLIMIQITIAIARFPSIAHHGPVARVECQVFLSSCE